ncbi:MAG: hypothetical protein PHG63_03340 [Candidatus Dojkabacteria bacterium]|nr:hypothetical protein [Candidatus Dojkabacteria bacterium]
MWAIEAVQLLSRAAITTEVNTAIGRIPADMGAFVTTLGRIGIGIGGVAAIALITAGSVNMLTSTGNPDKLMAAREMITNALLGLALIALALFVLQLLGWDILGLGEITGVQFNDWT